MAKSPTFDTYDPAKIDALREGVKPTAAPQAKPKHQPHNFECSECGDTIGPHWGEFGEFYCRQHAPDHLRYPGADR